MGEGAKRYKKLLKEYKAKKAVDITDFKLDFGSELKYGYWGGTKDLLKIKKNLKKLFPDDTKSDKFHPIEMGTWFEALSTSPAEPGLSNILRIPDSSLMNNKKIIDKRYFKKYWGIFSSLNAIRWFDEENIGDGTIPFREDIYSAGGWSDLHPVLVLRASGCEEIVYVTRQGGEQFSANRFLFALLVMRKKLVLLTELTQTRRRTSSKIEMVGKT